MKHRTEEELIGYRDGEAKEARGYRRAPEGMRRMPHGIGPHRGRCSERWMRCQFRIREKTTESGCGSGLLPDLARKKVRWWESFYRAATVWQPWAGVGGAGDPGVCCRPIDAPARFRWGTRQMLRRCASACWWWPVGEHLVRTEMGADGTGKHADAKGTKRQSTFRRHNAARKTWWRKNRFVPANSAEGRRSGDGEHTG